MSEIANNINAYLDAADKIIPYTSISLGFSLSLEKIGFEDLECVLSWFKDGGSFFRKIQKSFFKGGNPYHYYWLEKRGVTLGVRAVTIKNKRRPKGMAILTEAVANRIVAQCDAERIERAKQLGHKYFYEDGSLLKHVIELFGEPKER